MAYARFGKDSDVHVYEHADGMFVCEFCRIEGKMSADGGPRFETQSRAGMIEHLRKHQLAGDKVPDRTFVRIEEEIIERGDISG